MTGVKFECPGCGQHIECDKACCGDVIHCPRCCAELRIPFPKPQDFPGTIERAEMLMHAPTPPTAGLEALSTQGSAPQEKRPAEPIEVSCPVCHSELRVKTGGANKANSPARAEVLRKGQPEAQRQPETVEGHTGSAPARPDVNHMTFEERERHIAAAREARPVSLYGSMKPRMDKVLSGDLAPVKSAEPAVEKHMRRPPKGAEGGANVEPFSE
jgi:hypothetical protein